MTARSLTAHRVSVRHGRRTVLEQVSVSVRAGEVVGLTGASGSGKTTLAQVLSGLLQPDTGRVDCDGHELRGKHSGRIAMLFQSPRRSCDPRLTLRESITELARGRIEFEALRGRVGLTADLLDRYPAQVSDGQLQRAAVARVLAARPDYLLCDEMTAMLDPATTATVVRAVTVLAAEGVGVLLISHDLSLLAVSANRVVHLCNPSAEPQRGGSAATSNRHIGVS
ncbi:ABC transporter ATP-binding protein [Nocardia seriolae]|uniref:ABC transporter n=1 Tax=Nocardia seriolae TaxID=37332 RepID=A0A0B8NBZ1_9NOCA|nr:ATP-binding cassette domain-containing protein [Nocardia seriolae]APA96277.1 Hemin import ATP-binding protein HmuV [Nocardia seriolae]MTJ65659.1 ATP-binding cassette domain-containing protein [Nocardia seriolae]MTJ74892.1 ATP-binding cassette domain-containing protein [Nocardia seriolae]MTJ86412.1 ATP-binding cassette domain-containing protein [Nocardia seriolae]MTK30405.1 ATP-binding cassette domain-containing protein [Nocardia seriolae]